MARQRERASVHEVDDAWIALYFRVEREECFFVMFDRRKFRGQDGNGRHQPRVEFGQPGPRCANEALTRRQQVDVVGGTAPLTRTQTLQYTRIVARRVACD